MPPFNSKNQPKQSPPTLLLPFNWLTILQSSRRAINSGQFPAVKIELSSSRSQLKAISVLLSLFLLPLLTSCGSTETRLLQVPPLPIPVSLSAECPIPFIPDPLTWGASLELNERLLTALANCNNDKAAIRKIESSRIYEKRY